MSRLKRICFSGMTAHVVQRGTNRSETFFEARDYSEYLGLLRVALGRYGAQLHAYVLMSNHVHLLMTSMSACSVSKVMQYVAGQYAARLNARIERTGTLWEGRFRSSPIDSDPYCLACYRYIELNPVRAGIVRHPADYQWSSYGANAEGRASSLVTPHPTYVSLAPAQGPRHRRYRELLLGETLSDTMLARLRKGIRAGLPTGPAPAVANIEAALNGEVPGRRRRGRPRKQPAGREADWREE